jgi:hypothetical protein
MNIPWGIPVTSALVRFDSASRAFEASASMICPWCGEKFTPGKHFLAQLHSVPAANAAALPPAGGYLPIDCPSCRQPMHVVPALSTFRMI